jgi:hypothetical protein
VLSGQHRDFRGIYPTLSDAEESAAYPRPHSKYSAPVMLSCGGGAEDGGGVSAGVTDCRLREFFRIDSALTVARPLSRARSPCHLYPRRGVLPDQPDDDSIHASSSESWPRVESQITVSRPPAHIQMLSDNELQIPLLPECQACVRAVDRR